MRGIFSLFTLFLIFNAATAQERLFPRHGLFVNLEGGRGFSQTYKTSYNFGYSYQVNNYSRLLGGVKTFGLGRSFAYTDSSNIRSLKGAPNNLSYQASGLGFFLGYQVHSSIFNSKRWQFKISGIVSGESSNLDLYSNPDFFGFLSMQRKTKISEGSYRSVSLEVPMAIEYNIGNFFLELGSRILNTQYGMDRSTSLDQTVPPEFRENKGFFFEMNWTNSGYFGFGYRFGKKVGNKIPSDPSN
jgi:hypothetical protein